MRLKLHQLDRNKHDDIVTAVDWTVSNEALSVSDDRRLVRWSIDGSCLGELINGIDPQVTDIHCQAQGQPMVALAQSNGQYLIVNIGTGKVEGTSAKQHQGSITCIRWSSDGSTLLTAGEDGRILQWSRSGNLRSKLVSTHRAVYSCAWSPDNQAVLYASGSSLVIKPLRIDDKQTQWRTQCGLIIALDWSPVNGLIICGGEGCRYSIYDAHGQQLFCLSKPMQHPITSTKWAPNGLMFAAGSLDVLMLCDRSGWSYSRHAISTGSILSLSWTNDSTHIAGAGVNGSVVFGQVIDRVKQWRQFEATLNERNQVVVSNVIVDLAGKAFEVLDFNDRVIDFSIGFGHLVVATCKQLYSYNVETFAAPSIFDIKAGGAVHLIFLSERFFVLVGNSLLGIRVCSYDAREICTVKIPGLQTDYLTPSNIAISPDTMAIVDQSKGSRSILFLDINYGTQICKPFTSSEAIISIALSQQGLVSDRKIAFIDSRSDLWINLIHADQRPIKIASMASCMQFNSDNDALACMTDAQLRIWHYANVVFTDRALLDSTTESFVEGLGHNCAIHEFNGNCCTIRRQDGALISIGVMPYPSLLYSLTSQGQWTPALKLARFVNENIVWACLAAMAIHGRELDVAEHCFAAIDSVDRLFFIQNIKALAVKAIRDSELALFRRRPGEAEQILLGQKLFYRAIKLNIRLCNWQRALELAQKHGVHLDTVVGYRQEYLQRFKQEENLKEYTSITQAVKVDWNLIKQNETRELNLEASAKVNRT